MSLIELYSQFKVLDDDKAKKLNGVQIGNTLLIKSLGIAIYPSITAQGLRILSARVY